MKKTIIKGIGCGLLLLGAASCSDYLTKQPLNVIPPENVWQDPASVRAVFAYLYDKMTWEDFNYYQSDYWRLQNLTTMSDDGQGSFQKDPAFDNYNSAYNYEAELFKLMFSYNYKFIRNCNDALIQLESAGGVADEERASLEGELRFLRAMYYFQEVKRYGGVPLITEPQAYDPDPEKTMVPRNKEVELYDFVIGEAQKAAAVLPETRGGDAMYRVTKYGALALVSRAALYAGSIARYGKVQLDGLVGIPASEADHFFRTSYEASKKIIDSGVFKLYNQTPDDPTKNFCDMFLRTTNGNNGEYIFQIQYNAAGGRGHDWDKRNAPYSYNGGGYGCGVAPTLELVEAFDYKDGSKGTLKLADADGKPIHYKDPYDLFKDKDPRLLASVYVDGSPCEGTEVEWQRGIILPDGTKIEAVNDLGKDGIDTYVYNGKTYNVQGKDGGADVGDPSKTGFYQRKFFDETLKDLQFGKSETPWPVFRLGEMYLNLAEAAMELGKPDEALAAVNAIRKRAGVAEHTSITMDKIRNERRCELAFENHRYWDLLRWRLADKDAATTVGGLNNFRGTALHPYLNVADGTYTFERGTKTPKRYRLFYEKNYYLRISMQDFKTNHLLVQNPGYTN